jgi:putative copper export protein/methionine-rich copper-binding protein CopC
MITGVVYLSGGVVRSANRPVRKTAQGVCGMNFPGHVKHRIVSIGLVLATTAVLAVGMNPTHAAAVTGDEVVTVPTGSSSVSSVDQVSVSFSSAVDPAGSSATVYSADHKVAAKGVLVKDPKSDGTLTLAVPKLADGIYTVVWSVEKNPVGPSTGAFAFGVDPKAAPPKTVTSPKTAFALRPIRNVLVAWVPWVGIMVLIGALMLRFLVTAPSARHMDPAGGDEVLAATDRRLVAVAAVALLALVPATIVELAFSAGANKTFAYSGIWKLMTANGAGHLRFARLVAVVLAAAVMIPAALRGTKAAAWRPKVMLGGLLLGLVEMVARVAPSGVPVNKPRTLLGDLFILGHILSGAVWVGGLVGIVAIALRKGVPAARRAAFWPTAFKRFSVTAMSCVGIVTVSGLWLYWVHVANIGQMRSTLYGRTLTNKLLLVGVLLALGAFNQFWLKPHLETEGAPAGVNRLIDRHFRGVVAIEAIVGMAVLFIVPNLSGSSRNQAFQTKAADISRSASVSGGSVTLTPSGLIPGLANYDVTLNGATAKDVRLSFASPALGVPAHEVVPKSLGDGKYRASGMYTSMAGEWQVGVALDADTTPARFTLPITAKPVPLPRAPAPKIGATFWLYGLLEVVAIGLLLLGAARVSRRLGQRRAAMLAAAGHRSGNSQLQLTDR